MKYADFHDLCLVLESLTRAALLRLQEYTSEVCCTGRLAIHREFGYQWLPSLVSLLGLHGNLHRF